MLNMVLNFTRIKKKGERENLKDLVGKNWVEMMEKNKINK